MFEWREVVDDSVDAPSMMEHLSGVPVHRRQWVHEAGEHRYVLTAYLGLDLDHLSWVMWECEYFEHGKAHDYMRSGTRLFEFGDMRRVDALWQRTTPSDVLATTIWGDALMRRLEPTA